MKKIIAIALALSLTLCLGACGSKDGGKEDKVVLTYMASQDWVQEAEIELGEKFTEETGIEVDYQIIPGDQYQNILTTKINTGELTDLFGLNSGVFVIQSQIDAANNCVELTGEDWVARMDAEAMPPVSIDGAVYGQPYADVSATYALAYNKKIFEKYNLEIPTTYAEFTAVCDTLLANGVIPIYEAVASGWHHTLWFGNAVAPVMDKADPTIIDKLNNNQATFADSALAKEVIGQIAEMAEKGYWGEDYMSNIFPDAAKCMASGEYAMVLSQQGLGNDIHAIDPDFDPEDIGYFVAPLGNSQVFHGNTAGVARFINKDSENIEAAKMYLEFMTRTENLDYMIDNVAKFNTMPYDGAKSNALQSVQDLMGRYEDSCMVTQQCVKYVNDQWNDIGKELTALVTNQQSVDDVLTHIDENRANIAKAAKDSNWN